MWPRAQTGTSRTALVAVALGLVAFLFHLYAISRPGPWGDEAVTVMSVRRSLDSLARSLRIHDLVHGPYYIVGHVWGRAFGTEVVDMRVLSALSVGVSTGLMVVLGTMLLDLRFGIYAALVFATLPRVIWTATEARSYALVTAVVIAVMISFLAALRRDSVAIWFGFGLVFVLSVLLFQFAALNFLVLPLVALAVQPTRRAVIRMGVTTALAALACVPFVVHTRRQLDTISWIADSFTLNGALKAVWTNQFLTPESVRGWVLIDLMVWLIALAGILIAARRARDDHGVRVTAVLTTGWLTLPTICLVGYSLVATPAFTERYLAPSAPALAMAVALALFFVPVRQGKELLGAALLVPVLLLSTGAWAYYHSIWAKSGWSSIAQAIQSHKEPGDVIVAAGPMEAATVVVLPDEFSALHVINIDVPYYADNTPWGRVTMIRDDPSLLDGHQRVWYLDVNGIAEADAAVFKAQGFTERWREQQFMLAAILYERD